jgi:hypothetical protein
MTTNIREQVAMWLFDMDYDSRWEHFADQSEYLAKADEWLAQPIVRAVAEAAWDEADKAVSCWYDDEHSPGPRVGPEEFPVNPFLSESEKR